MGIVGALRAMGDAWASMFTPPRNPRINKILRDSQRRQQWYHEGPWWRHPLWRDEERGK